MNLTCLCFDILKYGLDIIFQLLINGQTHWSYSKILAQQVTLIIDEDFGNRTKKFILRTKIWLWLWFFVTNYAKALKTLSYENLQKIIMNIQKKYVYGSSSLTDYFQSYFIIWISLIKASGDVYLKYQNEKKIFITNVLAY